MGIEHINILIAVVSALCGVASGIYLTGKRQGGREIKLEQQGKDIAGFKNERSKLLGELKAAVCDGFKLAIAELRIEQAERHGGHDTAIAALVARMDSAENDITEIFGRLNRREYDYGHPEGDRRKNSV